MIGGDAKLQLGTGATTIEVTRGSVIHGKLDAKTAIDSDRVEVSDSTIDDAAKLLVGAGNNDVFVINSKVGGKLTIKAGNGNDLVNVTGTTAAGGTVLDAGGGVDTVIP